MQRPSEQHFVASILGLSNVVAGGKTEAEAITKIKAALKSQLAASKVVTIDIDSEPNQIESTDPLIKNAGSFADDPMFDDFLNEVAAFRKQVDDSEPV